MDCCGVSSRAGADSVCDQIWARLVQISLERVHRHFGAIAAELDLAPAQALALHELEDGVPMSMRELAARMKCDPSNITGLIDRLEARGLVERRAHPSDRRVKYLALTGEGQQLRERLAVRLYSAPSWVAALAESDQRALQDVLARLLEARD
jgi:DNA-binding MarR family transcriptional regulator